MDKERLDTLKMLGFEQGENEDEFDLRKRAFVKIFPEDSMEAVESLFGIRHFSDLKQDDMTILAGARKWYDLAGEAGLWEFLNKFIKEDPAIPYEI